MGKVLLEVFHNCPFQYQKLQFAWVIALLMRCKCFAAIGNRVVPPICLFLWQHWPKSIFWCISLQQEWFGVDSKSPNGGCHTCLFQCFESLHGFFIKWHPLWLSAGPFPCEVLTEWLCNAFEPFDEPPVVALQAKKGTHLCITLRQSIFCNCFQIQVAGAYPILWDLMG